MIERRKVLPAIAEAALQRESAIMKTESGVEKIDSRVESTSSARNVQHQIGVDDVIKGLDKDGHDSKPSEDPR